MRLAGQCRLCSCLLLLPHRLLPHLHGQRLPVVGKLLEDGVCILHSFLILLGLQQRASGRGASGRRCGAVGQRQRQRRRPVPGLASRPARSGAGQMEIWFRQPRVAARLLPVLLLRSSMQDGAMAGGRTSYCLANCLKSAASLLGSTRSSA